MNVYSEASVDRNVLHQGGVDRYPLICDRLYAECKETK